MVASRYNVWENCTLFALTLWWGVSLHCLMFDIHVSFHSACIEKYQFTVGAGIAEQWDVESAQFQKSDKLREVMSSETGNLVQFMFHTRFMFECDKYKYIRGEIQMYFTPDFRLIVTNTRLCNLHTGYQNQLSRFCSVYYFHIVDSCDLQIWLANIRFLAANIQMRSSHWAQFSSKG